MTIASAALIDVLQGAADCAAEAETAVRRESERRIAALARERSFAFRKVHLIRAVVAAVAGAETVDAVPALAAAVLCREFGWSGGSDAERAVLDRFAPVARATFASLAPPTRGDGHADALAELAAFEAWYADTHIGPFWALFDQYVPETSATDF
jgi:hypothetical protein